MYGLQNEKKRREVCMITLQVTPTMQDEMTHILLEFGERHDLSMEETYYCVLAAIAHQGYIVGRKENYTNAAQA